MENTNTLEAFKWYGPERRKEDGYCKNYMVYAYWLSDGRDLHRRDEFASTIKILPNKLTDDDDDDDDDTTTDRCN